MARLTARERRMRTEAFRLAVEQSRQTWLGKRIQFRDLLDKKVKIGTITRVEESGLVVMEYQAFPWPGEPPGEWCTQVGHEMELLRMLDGVVLADA